MDNENIEEILKRLGTEDMPADVHKIAKEASSDFSKRVIQTGQTKYCILWEYIMKSKITKLAAAAVIIIGVLVGINYFGGSVDGAKAAYGITDIPRLIRDAKTLHVQATVWGYSDAGKWELTTETMLPQEWWVDLGNFKSYEINFEASSSPSEGKRTSLMEQCGNGQYIMTVDHTRKKVWFNKNDVKEESRLKKIVDDFLYMFGVDELEEFEKVGQERIKGEMFDIWQREETKDNGNGPYMEKTRCWILPSSGEVARVYKWYKGLSGYWRPSWLVETIERDIKIDPKLFEFKDLKNYYHMNRPEDL